MTEDRAIGRKLLLEGIYLKYGYDFRQYSEESLNRRLDNILSKYDKKDELDLLAHLFRDPDFFRTVLPDFTVTTSEIFRDPLFYLSFRQNVVPVLKTYPTLKFWIAGCSSGEEVYSLAITLKEEGLYERSVIHATDINPKVLKAAQEGIYDLETIKLFTKNYVAAGGRGSPSDYYTADYNLARFRPELRENVVFSEHNLVTDGVFLEAHVIWCRNVLIYFNQNLQNRALELFYDSLASRGFLGLGSKESISFSSQKTAFETLDAVQRIFQKNPFSTGATHGKN